MRQKNGDDAKFCFSCGAVILTPGVSGPVVTSIPKMTSSESENNKTFSMKWFIKVLKNYAVFEGRARRKEYWMFVLTYFAIAYAMAISSGIWMGVLGFPQVVAMNLLNTFASILTLVMVIPSFAVSVRRIHDTDHGGWWLLLPIYNLILLVSDGTKGNNRFGPDPKNE